MAEWNYSDNDIARWVSAKRVEELIGEIDVCRRDISALRWWADHEAPRFRRAHEAVQVLLALGDRVGTLELHESGADRRLTELKERLDAHAQVTIGRLEALEGALGEGNGWAEKFADRRAALEGLERRITTLEAGIKGAGAMVFSPGEKLPE